MRPGIARLPQIVLLLAAFAVPAFAAPGAPPGWSATGWPLQDYEFGTDAPPGVTGKQAAYVKGKTASAVAGGYGSLSQCIAAEHYIGQRVRLSARLKSLNALFASMFMQINSGARLVGSYNMDDHPLSGSVDWRHEDIVLEVPQGGTQICYGVLLMGGVGEVWADSFSLTSAGNETPLSRPPIPLPPTHATPANLDFEQSPRGMPQGWTGDASPGVAYIFGTAKVAGADGNTAYISGYANGMGASLGQRFSAQPYLGKRVRVSTRLKTDNVEGASCSMGIWKGASVTNGGNAPRLTGTRAWTPCSVVADVASDAERIRISIFLRGKGMVWADDVHVETVGLDVPVTDPLAKRADQPRNPGFDP